MKKKADGTTIDFRDGETQHGGGSSQRLTITSGYSNDRFDSVFSVELLQSSSHCGRFSAASPIRAWTVPADPSRHRTRAPVLRAYRLSRAATSIPGQATCNSLSRLDNGTIFRAARDRYGPGPDYGTG